MTESSLSEGADVGDYKAVRVISRGDFGTLYEVKKGRASFTMQAKKSEEQWEQDSELGIMDGLPHHPHVATFLESIKQENIIYYVFENCNIGTLNEFVINEKPRDQFILGLMFDMAQGLFHLHRNKLIHRDLNPDNILIAAGKNRPICKLSHLDLAQYCNCNNQLDSVPNVLDISKHSDINAFLKTKCISKYWPPEIKEPGDSFRFASDIFSLGLVFLSISVRNIKFDKTFNKDVICPPTVKANLGGEVPLFLCTDMQTKELVYTSLKTVALQDLVYSMLHYKHSKRPQALQLVTTLETFVPTDRSIPIVYIALVSVTIVLLVIFVTWKLTFA